MKKWLAIGVSLLLFVTFFSGCSKDGVTVATYSNGKNTQSVKVKDVKDELMQYVNYNPVIVGDSAWHSDYIFSRYIAMDLAYLDELAQGITNQADFKSIYDSQYKKQSLILLYRKGQEMLNDEAKNAKYEFAKASHILLMTSKQTNINGKMKELSDSQYQKIVSEKEKQAEGMIISLKAAKNLQTEFSNMAVLRSEDGGSSPAGGDVGYFTRGIMVKEFEEAAFGADKKGLIEKPVKTSYGIHVIFITDPMKKGTMGDIERSSGKQAYQRMEPYFRTSYYKANRSNNVKDFYTVDTNSKTILVDGKKFNVKELPADLKLFSVYGKVYNWKDTKEVFEIMIPNFVKDMNIQGFEEQMENLKNFIQFVEVAKSKGYEKSSKFIADMNKMRTDIVKTIAAQFFQRDFMKKIKEQMTDQAAMDYYKANKPTFTKDVKGQRVQLSFQEAKNQVKEEFEKKLTQDFYRQWSEDAKKKYKVAFDKGGLKALEDLEKDQMKKAQKRMEEQQKKAQNQPPMQIQPQNQPRPQQKIK